MRKARDAKHAKHLGNLAADAVYGQTARAQSLRAVHQGANARGVDEADRRQIHDNRTARLNAFGQGSFELRAGSHVEFPAHEEHARAVLDDLKRLHSPPDPETSQRLGTGYARWSWLSNSQRTSPSLDLEPDPFVPVDRKAPPIGQSVDDKQAIVPVGGCVEGGSIQIHVLPPVPDDDSNDARLALNL